MGKGNGPGRQGGACDRDLAAIGAAGSARRGDCTTRSGRLREGVGRPGVRPARSLPSHWLRQEQARVGAGGCGGVTRPRGYSRSPALGLLGHVTERRECLLPPRERPLTAPPGEGPAVPKPFPGGLGEPRGPRALFDPFILRSPFPERVPLGCSRTGARTRSACMLSRPSSSPTPYAVPFL